jgi:hypothetical protein
MTIRQCVTYRNGSSEGHYGKRHTAFWSCTHIPNIIDLSGKTKKLWSGQASLRRSGRRRRSGRKNQTKTICLFTKRKHHAILESLSITWITYNIHLYLTFFILSSHWSGHIYVSPSNEERHIVLVWFFLPHSNTSHDLYILDQSCHTPSWLFSGELYPSAEKLDPISIPRGSLGGMGDVL